MRTSQSLILSGTMWTILAYGISTMLRLGSNVVLSRLLAPELIGIIVVVNTIRVGVELFSDLGIEQNIVSHKDGNSQDFLNTAWTMQVMRGVFLSLVFLAISPTLAALYKIDLSIFLIVSFSPFLNSLASTSVFVLVKALNARKRYAFEITSETISFAATIFLAWWLQNVWAVVAGTLLSIAIRSTLSHFLPHPPHRFVLVKKYAWEIVHLGKWIMLFSLLMYASSQADKIYLGKTLPFEIFGIYGLARTIADLPSILAGKLCYQIFFPMISASKGLGAQAIVKTLWSPRWKLLLAGCIGMSIVIAFSDYAIAILYDPRYHDAGWMLFVLLFGAWFAVLSSLNEAVLLAEKPVYLSASHCVRLVGLVVGLYIGTTSHGISGALIAVATSEFLRYVTLTYGQHKVKFSFIGQDASMTVLLVVLVGLWSMVRLYFNLGTAWNGLF